MITDGSSPLTRGKRSESQRSQTQRRLIPAHAGKTVSQAWGSAARSAHPRSRGENAPTPTAAVAPSGSSPLTRGKRAACSSETRASRLIPAHAGKTCLYTSFKLVSEAHPRSRGENACIFGELEAHGGSSPLTRGKLRGIWTRVLPGRLIPAHAGKTPCAGRSGTRSPAHPRSRGENKKTLEELSEAGGSSPLTRGKRTTSTPAPRTSRAHPRSRGENPHRTRMTLTSTGSSPLTRGKQLEATRPASRLGLIPAHAGKTCPRRAGATRPEAHPRSRGENTS